MTNPKSPSPETHLNVKDHTKLDGPELWELTFGILEGDVPEQMTDEVFTKMAEAINNVFVDPLQLAGKFPSPETRDAADVEAVVEAARRLVHGAFRRDGETLPDDARPCFSIPAKPDNDDILVMQFLKSCRPSPDLQTRGTDDDR